MARVLSVDLRPSTTHRQVIIVDDGSTDGTAALVRELSSNVRALLGPAIEHLGSEIELALLDVEIRCLLHEHNQGKGAALRDGCEQATGDLILFQDADLEYDPRDYPKLLKPLLEDHADVVFGSRFLSAERRALLFWHSVGNRFLTTFSNAVNDLYLTDMETGYKVFRADVIKNLRLESSRFGIEPEITAKVARMRYRVYEVPISYYGRGYEAGKKIDWSDGLAAFWHVLHYRFSSEIIDARSLEETLQKMGGMRRFNKSLFAALEPWLGETVLEAGSGHGTITDYLARRGKVIATDKDPSALHRLRSAFVDLQGIQVLEWDLEKPFPEAIHENVDTIVSVNVLEHVANEAASLENARQILAPRNGRLVVLVPAHPWLFSELDRSMGHHRRYTRASLTETLERAGFEIEHLQWFNVLGLGGWLLNGKLLGRRQLPSSQLGVFNVISRLWLPVEEATRPPLGLSLLAVGRPRREAP